MRTFRFRLDPVLVLRRQKEELSKAAYAEAVGERVAMERERENVAQRVADLKSCIARTRDKNFKGSLQQAYSDSLLEQEKALAKAKLAVSNALSKEENALCFYIMSKRDRELVDRWRSHQKQEHFQAALKEEEHEIEDLANARYIRRRQAKGACL